VEDWSRREEENKVVRELLHTLDAHSPGERAHAERVAVYSVAIGHHLGLRDEELLHLRYAASLHDVGKVRLDRELLSKVGELTEEDIWDMHLHALFGERVLENIEFLGPSMPMIRHHHERWDGEGYPNGLKEDSIPLGARIIAVAETFDTLVNAPFFKRPMDEKAALDEVRRCAGGQFDPEVVNALEAVQPLIQPMND
jgi:response regulator RpfG family c-di-GMP phosphodiesterase